MCDCEIDIINDAVHIGPFHYICPKCQKDISLMYYLVYEALNQLKEKGDGINKKYKSKSNR
jgi:hypothetical protein